MEEGCTGGVLNTKRINMTRALPTQLPLPTKDEINVSIALGCFQGQEPLPFTQQQRHTYPEIKNELKRVFFFFFLHCSSGSTSTSSMQQQLQYSRLVVVDILFIFSLLLLSFQLLLILFQSSCIQQCHLEFGNRNKQACKYDNKIDR